MLPSVRFPFGSFPISSRSDDPSSSHAAQASAVRSVSNDARIGDADDGSNDAQGRVSTYARPSASSAASAPTLGSPSARVQPVGKLFHAGTLRWVRFARQAISNGTVEPMGHELTFRWDAGRDRTDEPPSPYGVCMTLSHALLDGGLKHRAAGSLFVTLDRETLMSRVADALCTPHFIIQIPRSMPVDAEVTRRMAQLHAAGYAFALSDLGGPDDPRWVWAPLVRYAKLQVAREASSGWAGWLRRAECAGLQVIVEGLTEAADYVCLRRLGVHRFQGPLIHATQEESVRALPCCDGQVLHKLNRLVEQGASRETLAMVSATDPALVIRLLMLQRIYAEGWGGTGAWGVHAAAGSDGSHSAHVDHPPRSEIGASERHDKKPWSSAAPVSAMVWTGLGGAGGIGGTASIGGVSGVSGAGGIGSISGTGGINGLASVGGIGRVGDLRGSANPIGGAGATGSWGTSVPLGQPFTSGSVGISGHERFPPAATLADVLEAVPYRVLSGWMRILRHSSFDPHESGRAWSVSVREQMYNFRARLLGARACGSPQELEARVFGLYRRLCSREVWMAVASNDEPGSPDLSGEAPPASTS